MAGRGSWVSVKQLTASEKQAIADRCEEFVAQRLKPLVFSNAHPTPCEEPLDIFGKWRGSKYVFFLRSRSGYPETAGQEFDSPFACLAYLEAIITDARFDVQWFRHTGKWWTLHPAVSLDEAFGLIETNRILHPPI